MHSSKQASTGVFKHVKIILWRYWYPIKNVCSDANRITNVKIRDIHISSHSYRLENNRSFWRLVYVESGVRWFPEIHHRHTMSKENSRFGNNTQIKGMLCLCWLFKVTVAKFDTVTKSAYKYITAAAMLLSNCYAVYLRSSIKHYKCYKTYISYHIHSSNKTSSNYNNTIQFS